MTLGSEKFCHEYIQSRVNEDVELHGGLAVEYFTNLVTDRFIQNGKIDSFDYHYSSDPEIFGYTDDLGNSLSIFVSIFKPNRAIQILSKEEVNDALEEGLKVFKIIENQKYPTDKKHQDYDLYKELDKIDKAIPAPGIGKIILITNGYSEINLKKIQKIGLYNVEFNIYSITELNTEFFGTSDVRSKINVNFKAIDPKISIQLIDVTRDRSSNIRSFLSVIPGTMIYSIYNKYGSKLLERNVRGYLKSSGIINKGIKKTILNEPKKFFAYNNGISILGSDIKYKANNREIFLTEIEDFQIVNGGQTISSLYFTKKENISAQIRDVSVLAKVTIIKDKGKSNEIINNISLYNNSQNKVSLPDLQAGSPFNLKIEDLSKTLQTPSKSFWFFERLNKSYDNQLLNVSVNKSIKLKFQESYPKSQKFTKEDVMLVLLNWDLYPYISSRGPSKSLNFFIENVIKKDIKINNDILIEYISKIILYRTINKEATKMKLGQGKAKTTSIYLMSYISFVTSRKINSNHIWENEKISNEFELKINSLLQKVNRAIEDDADKNESSVSEWTKKEDCWNKVKSLKLLDIKSSKYTDFK
jgi:hypothetical protein